MLLPALFMGLFWIVLPLLNFHLAKKKNRSSWKWALFGLPLPITSTLVLALWPGRKPGKREIVSPGILLFLISLIGTFWMYIEMSKREIKARYKEENLQKLFNMKSYNK